MTESPADTLIASPDAVITDAQGNVWSLQNGQVVENGIPDPTTANVIALAYAPYQSWQERYFRLQWCCSPKPRPGMARERLGAMVGEQPTLDGCR